MEYRMADENDKTEDLEQEDLTGAVDDTDEDEEDGRSDGQLLYEILKKRDLVADGNWSDLTKKLRDKWDSVASDFSMGDVRTEMLDELE